MDTRKNNANVAVKIHFEKKALMQKTVAGLVTVFFIFYGIPMPTSFADAPRDRVSPNEQGRWVPTIPYDPSAVEKNSVPQKSDVPPGEGDQRPLSVSKKNLPQPAGREPAASPAFYDPSRLTVLPGRPVVGSGVGGAVSTSVTGTVQVVQSSSQNVEIRYNDLDSDDYAYVYFSNGYFNAEQFTGQTMDLSGGITVALNGAAGRQIKLELKDVNGNRASFYLTLAGTLQNYEISNSVLSSFFPQVDKTHIAEVVFVMDPSHMGASGSVSIETRGLDYTPVVPSSPYLDSSSSTFLPGLPAVGVIRNPDFDATGRVTQEAVGGQYVRLDFDVAAPGTYAGIAFTFDAPVDLLSGSQALSFGARGGAGIDIKMEIETLFNGISKKDFVILKDITDISAVKYTVMGVLFDGLNQDDLAHIKAIRFIVDQGLSPQPQSTFYIIQRGAAFVPAITTPTVAPLTDLRQWQPSATSVEAVHGTTVVNFTQPSDHQFGYDFNLPAGGSQSWAAGMILFPQGQTLNATSADIVLGVNLTGASYYKIEVQDQNGQKVTVRVNIMNGRVAITNALLQSAGVAGFDAAHVQAIVLVVDDPQATTGHMTVDTKGLEYTATVAPSPTLTPADLSGLPSGTAGQPQIAVVSADGAGAAATTAERGMSFTFNTGIPGWAGGGLTFDDFGTPTYETVDLSQLSDLRFELWGNVPSGRVKMEVIDANNNRDWVYLTSITTAQGQVWKIQTADLPGVDLTHVRIIYFIAESVNQQGELHVNYISSLPQVPTGWTRAASNANFAFILESTSSSKTLKVMDLRTGQSQDLHDWYLGNPVSNPFRFASVYDVSSDGTTVIYGASPWEHGGDHIYVQKLTEGSPSLILSGELQGIVFNGQVVEITKTDGTKQWVDLNTLTIVSPPVPAGWTRAASNANYAFKITPYVDSVGMNRERLEIIDLRTGQARMIEEVSVVRGGNPFTGVVDIHPDGSSMIYENESMYAGQKTLTVFSLTGAFDPIRIYELDRSEILGVEFSAGYISVHAGPDLPSRTTSGVFKIDLANASYEFIPDVPSGWTRAASNANYAFKINYEGSIGKLMVLDLTTGAEQQIATADHSGGYPASFDNTMDIDAAGIVVIYGISRPPYGTTSYVQNLANSSQNLVLSGRITAITYEASDRVLISVVKDALPNPGTTAQYRVYYGQGVAPSLIPLVPQGWTRAASNVNYAYRQAQGVVLEVMDLITGSTSVVYDDSADNKTYDFVDISQDGHVVFSLSDGRSGTRGLYVAKLDGSDLIALPTGGYMSIREVVFSTGHISIRVDSYNPNVYPNGGVYEIDTLTKAVTFIPNVPEGWMRAASNANYAFRVLTVGKGQSLIVKDLLTGKDRTVISVGAAWRIGNAYDIAPDGKTVVYVLRKSGTNTGTTVVQNLLDPSKKLLLEGLTTFIQFTGDYWTLTINKRIVKVNPVTLKVIRR